MKALWPLLVVLQPLLCAAATPASELHIETPIFDFVLPAGWHDDKADIPELARDDQVLVASSFSEGHHLVTLNILGRRSSPPIGLDFSAAETTYDDLKAHNQTTHSRTMLGGAPAVEVRHTTVTDGVSQDVDLWYTSPGGDRSYSIILTAPKGDDRSSVVAQAAKARLLATIHWRVPITQAKHAEWPPNGDFSTGLEGFTLPPASGWLQAKAPTEVDGSRQWVLARLSNEGTVRPQAPVMIVKELALPTTTWDDAELEQSFRSPGMGPVTRFNAQVDGLPARVYEFALNLDGASMAYTMVGVVSHGRVYQISLLYPAGPDMPRQFKETFAQFQQSFKWLPPK